MAAFHPARTAGYDKVAQVVEDADGSLWVGYRDAYGITPSDVSGRADGEVKMESSRRPTVCVPTKRCSSSSTARLAVGGNGSRRGRVR